MQVLHEITKNQNNLAIALGYFDGMHIGHRKIIKTLLNAAKDENLKTAVVTFDKNPANYFIDEPIKDIQTYKDKELILDSLGVDYLYELDFEKYKDMSAFDYLNDVLVKNLNPSYIVVGYNHTFGKDKLGNPAFLKDMERQNNYKCLIVEEQKYNNKEEVSSTVIRQKIQYGYLDEVKAFLGRYFTIRNSVIKGNKMARALGYPTANIVWPYSLVQLPYGLYYGFAQVGTKMLPALISWGNKPTLTDGKNEIIEAHIYDFSEDLYGKIIKVAFVEKVRDIENYGDVRVLKTQIQKDYKRFEIWAKQMDNYR